MQYCYKLYDNTKGSEVGVLFDNFKTKALAEAEAKGRCEQLNALFEQPDRFSYRIYEDTFLDFSESKN